MPINELCVLVVATPHSYARTRRKKLDEVAAQFLEAAELLNTCSKSHLLRVERSLASGSAPCYLSPPFGRSSPPKNNRIAYHSPRRIVARGLADKAATPPCRMSDIPGG